MKTIKKIADELGVSKQAVHQKRKSKGLSTALQPFTSTVDGVVYISVDGEMLIKSAFEGIARKHVDVNNPSTVDSQNELYKILKSELEAKNEQIETLQAELAAERQHSREQSDKLAVLADTAQRLHAGTIQQQLPAAEVPAEPDAPIGADDKKNAEDPRGLLSRIFSRKKTN